MRPVEIGNEHGSVLRRKELQLPALSHRADQEIAAFRRDQRDCTPHDAVSVLCSGRDYFNELPDGDVQASLPELRELWQDEQVRQAVYDLFARGHYDEAEPWAARQFGE